MLAIISVSKRELIGALKEFNKHKTVFGEAWESNDPHKSHETVLIFKDLSDIHEKAFIKMCEKFKVSIIGLYEAKGVPTKVPSR